VKRRLKNYLQQNPQLSPKIASSKHNLAALSDLAYQGLNAVPGQSNHDHIDRMKDMLHAEYNNHILSGLSTDQAIALVTTKFKNNLAEDKKRNEEEKQFVNKHGYVEIINKDKRSVESVGVTIEQNNRLKTLSSMKDELGDLALGSILPVGEAQKIAKQILVRPGGKPYVFTEYQKQAAAMFGYSHPYSMIKAIIENEPVKEGEEKVMVELPPIVEFADQNFTPAQKALFGNSYKASRRSLAMQDGVPVSSVFETGQTLEKTNLEKLAIEAGFTPEEAKIASRIALAESSGNSTAFNGVGPDESYGLMQINMLGAMGPERRAQFGIQTNEDLYDPLTNMRAALDVYKRQGWGAWSVYTSGAYNKF